MTRRDGRPRAAVLVALVCAVACAPGDHETKRANSTLVVGLDVSGSFKSQYPDAVDFAS
jgi:hypothetical protein